MRTCAVDASCLDDKFDARFDFGPKGIELRAWSDQELKAVDRRLVALYGDIRREAPNARILVLSYPDLLSSGSGSSFSIQGGFNALVGLNDDCRRFPIFGANSLLSLENKLNQTVESAANAAGVEYVSISTIFAGHEPCGDLTPRWIKYPQLDLSGIASDPGTFHPTRAGEAVLAHAVACYLHLFPRAQRNVAHNLDQRGLAKCLSDASLKPGSRTSR